MIYDILKTKEGSNMKRLILILVVLVSGLAFVFANGTAEGGTQTISAGEPMTITMGSMGNPNTHTGQSGPFIVQRVEELTDGNLSIDLYDQSKLGQDAALLQQCMDGTVPFVAISMSIFSNFTPMLDVVQLPFLINSYELEKAMFETDEFWALAEAVGEELGVKIVGVGENGMRHFATNGRPINSPEDLHGMIIRTAQSNMLIKAMSACGANANPLAYSEVYTAMQNHIVDGLEINLMSVKSMSLFEVADYMSFIGLYPYASIYVFNRDIWESLPAEYQDAILQACEEAKEKLFSEWLPQEDQEAYDLALSEGMVFNDVENVEAFEELMTPLYDEYRDMDPLMAAFIDKAQELKATME